MSRRIASLSIRLIAPLCRAARPLCAAVIPSLVRCLIPLQASETPFAPKWRFRALEVNPETFFTVPHRDGDEESTAEGWRNHLHLLDAARPERVLYPSVRAYFRSCVSLID